MSLSRPLRLYRRLQRLDREEAQPSSGPCPPQGRRRPRDVRACDSPVASRRLRRLSWGAVAGHEAPVAVGFRARLLGLALLDRAEASPGLLIPHCAAVHTFGMRFDLDLYFLDADGSVLAAHRAVPPRRFVAHRGAAAVLEVPSPSGS
jgi:uncharacterized protein